MGAREALTLHSASEKVPILVDGLPRSGRIGVVVLLIGGAALIVWHGSQPRHAQPSTAEDGRNPEARQHAKRRATAAGGGGGGFDIAVFEAGLRELSLAFCAVAGGGECRPEHFARTCNDPESAGDLENQHREFAARTSKWVRRFPLPQGAVRQDAVDALRRTARDEMAPASTLVVISIIEALPDIAPAGLLSDVAISPPAGCSLAASEAFAVLSLAAQDSDFPFLEGVMSSGTPGQKRAAILALAALPNRRGFLAKYLRREVGSLEPGMVRRLSRVLVRSGLVRDQDLLRTLVESGDPQVGQEVALALGRCADSGRGDELLSWLESYATARNIDVNDRAASFPALRRSGQPGWQRLAHIAGDTSNDPATRLLALEALSSDHFAGAPRAALQLVSECHAPWEVAMAANIVLQDPSLEARLRESLAAWVHGDLERSIQLGRSLRNAPSAQMRALADAAGVDISNGGAQ